jgi:hypothetical protein
MAQARKDLNYVSKLALEKKEFFEKLLENIEDALSREKIELSDDDLYTLKQYILGGKATATLEVDVVELLKIYHDPSTDLTQWPIPWPITPWDLQLTDPRVQLGKLTRKK